MRDYIELGPAPCCETPAQMGTADYYEKAPKECRAYINQLRRIFGPEPEGARLSSKSFSHDFGDYREVVVYFDDSYSESIEYAFRLEGDLPEEWDEEAKRELLMI
jgi:hypothetical protein